MSICFQLLKIGQTRLVSDFIIPIMLTRVVDVLILSPCNVTILLTDISCVIYSSYILNVSEVVS